MSERHMCEVDCELKHETDDAYLVVIDDEEHWVPKRLSEFTPTTADGVVGELSLPEWFAQREGMI